MKLKVKHFHVYDLITVCFDYASEILRTKYREPVQYIGSQQSPGTAVSSTNEIDRHDISEI